MLSKITKRTMQVCVLIAVVVGIGFWTEPSKARDGVEPIIELAQGTPSTDPFTFALFNGPLPAFNAALDAALDSTSNPAAADAFLIRLANIIANITRQGYHAPGILTCGRMRLLLAELASRTGSVQTQSAIAALSVNVSSARPCSIDSPPPPPPPPPPPQEFGECEGPQASNPECLD